MQRKQVELPFLHKPRTCSLPPGVTENTHSTCWHYFFQLLLEEYVFFMLLPSSDFIIFLPVQYQRLVEKLWILLWFRPSPLGWGFENWKIKTVKQNYSETCEGQKSLPCGHVKPSFFWILLPFYFPLEKESSLYPSCISLIPEHLTVCTCQYVFGDQITG